MEPTCFRAVYPDFHLGLAIDEIILLTRGGVFVAWPRPRRVVPNYGYLVGLLATDRITILRTANLTRYLDAVAGLLPPPVSLPQKPGRTKRVSGRRA